MKSTQLSSLFLALVLGGCASLGGSSRDAALEARVATAAGLCSGKKDIQACSFIDQLRAECANRCNRATQGYLDNVQPPPPKQKGTPEDAVKALQKLASFLGDTGECSKCKAALSKAAPR